MKSKLSRSVIVPALLALSILNSGLATSFAQGTAFTYQGSLNEASNLANGDYDLRFHLYNSATNGTLVAGPLTNLDVGVSNGLFMVTIDFGDVFDGTTLWLQIGVRTNGATNFIALSPRQELTPTPYAVFAEGANAAGLSGTIPMSSLGGAYSNALNLSNTANSFAGDGAALANVNALTLDGLSGAAFWNTNGNAGVNPTNGAFLGTTDNNPLALRVNNTRVLRLEPDQRGLNAGNVIGGHPANAVQQPGSGGDVIAGGGFSGGGNMILSNSSGIFIGAGSVNQVGPNINDSVIAGGYGNTIASADSVIAGGNGNIIQSDSAYAAIGGGQNNTIETNNFGGVIAGGYENMIEPISGYSAIGGGYSNSILASSSFAVIAGGQDNTVDTNNFLATISGGYSNVINANSGLSTIAGGYSNSIASSASFSAIGGGFGNIASGQYSTVAGGFFNTAEAFSVAGGGAGNEANGQYATVSGGRGNAAFGDYSMAPGGDNNGAFGTYSFAAGDNASANKNGSFVWSDSTGTLTQDTASNQFVARASGGFYFYSGTGSAGAQLKPTDTSWTALSDRNTKKDIETEDCQEVLNKLAQVPISRWHYNWEPETNTPHIGPMAQDFKHVFYPGRDDKGITTLEFDGVELAAIQGLNQKLEETRQTVRAKDGEIHSLQLQNELLAERLTQLEAAMKELAARR
jgi:hypothetical protein